VPFISKNRARLGEQTYSSPEEFKAWSQNLGHEKVLTTLTSYGQVDRARQEDIIRKLWADWKSCACSKRNGVPWSKLKDRLARRFTFPTGKKGGEGLAVINGISCPPAKTRPHIASQQKINARPLADAISNFGSCLQSPNGCAGAPMIATPRSSTLGEGVDELLA
jgi:hypothetical protein